MNSQMKSAVWQRIAPVLKRALLLHAAFTLTAGAFAQQVIVPPATVPPTPAPATATPSGETGGAIMNTSAARMPFQWGPITLHPHLSYQIESISGLQSSTNS